MDILRIWQGRSPLIISFPHAGTYVPEEIAGRFSDEGWLLRDTDWHLPRLYSFLEELDVTRIEATHSRYVVDLNRAPDGSRLYEQDRETPLCPLHTFRGAAIYKAGEEPDQSEIDTRIAAYWRPYHDVLASEIDRLKALHGFALLFDAHSIHNCIPELFDGFLPDFNFGSADGQSCAPELSTSLMSQAWDFSAYRAVLNGRFKGGFITRHYGCPEEGCHAIQLELSQATYMNATPPFQFSEAAAAQVRPALKRFIDCLLAFTPKA